MTMKTILWATLSANGNYARNDPAHPPKAEALADFSAHVQATGNFIVGRRTFESFQARSARAEQPGATSPAPAALPGSAVIVLVSSSLQIPGMPCAPSARAALALLRDRGHATALIAGGEQLHNAFLAEDLVDELVLNITPTLEDRGFKLVLPEGRRRDVQLMGSKALGGGVVQLRYALRGEPRAAQEE